MKKLNILTKEEEIPTAEEILSLTGEWIRNRNFLGMYKVCVELPRENDDYRYFLCQEEADHVYIFRVKKA